MGEENFNIEGENDVEVAEPQEQTGLISLGGEYTEKIKNESVKNEEVAEPQKVEQTPEQNAAFAKMRRELEEYKKQLEERDKWIAKTFKDYGIDDKDPWNSYKAKMEQQLIEQQKEYLREQGMDDALIEEYINLKQQHETLQSQIVDKKMVEDFDKLVEFTKPYGNLVKEPNDIPPEVWEMYDRGIDLVTAYKVVKFDELVNKGKESAKQQALNSINSKQHLFTEGDGAGDVSDVHIPEETLQMYIDMGMSRKEAMKFHKKLYG